MLGIDIRNAVAHCFSFVVYCSLTGKVQPLQASKDGLGHAHSLQSCNGLVLKAPSHLCKYAVCEAATAELCGSKSLQGAPAWLGLII